MLTYTKRNVDTITFICSLILFTCLNFAIHYFFSNFSLFPTQNREPIFLEEKGIVYSKVLPIHPISNKQEDLAESEEVNEIQLSNQLLQNIDKENKIEKTNQQTLTNPSVTRNNTLGMQVKETKEPTTQREAIAIYQESEWRIQIPRLNLDAHILEGTDSNIIVTAVGHFENTPDWNGNVCLVAHNRGYLCNFFANIKDLKQGDEIIYLTSQGKRVYQVLVNQVIEETDWSYLEPTKDNRITLITCEENRRTYRRCIQAVEVLTQENM